MALGLKKKDFDTTAEVLAQIRERLGLSFDPKNENYAEFVKSPQYRAMLRAEANEPKQDRGAAAQPKPDRANRPRPTAPQPEAQP